MANPTPNPTPEKKPGFGRNLAGFTGQTLVLLTGTTAVAPFRAVELALAMTGQMVQLAGVTIETVGLGISWVGVQTGRPGDLAGQAARQVNERVRAWRTQTPVEELGEYIPITCGPRQDTARKVAELRNKVREFGKMARQAFAENAAAHQAVAVEAAARHAAEAAEAPAATSPAS